MSYDKDVSDISPLFYAFKKTKRDIQHCKIGSLPHLGQDHVTTIGKNVK